MHIALVPTTPATGRACVEVNAAAKPPPPNRTVKCSENEGYKKRNDCGSPINRIELIGFMHMQSRPDPPQTKLDDNQKGEAERTSYLILNYVILNTYK
jgi:hypothetical protein